MNVEQSYKTENSCSGDSKVAHPMKTFQANGPVASILLTAYQHRCIIGRT
jgi:hypothetical protein